MFKSILPGKRISSTEFTMVTPVLADVAVNGKENRDVLPPSVLAPKAAATKSNKPKFSDKSKRKKGDDAPLDRNDMDQAFDKLLDDLQIPHTLRPKLLGMEPAVKAAMLKSSQVIVPPPSPPPTTRGLRRVQSGSSLHIESPRPQRIAPTHAPSRSQYQTAGRAQGADLASASQHSRGMSMDIPRPKSRAQGNAVAPDAPPAPKTLKTKASIRNLAPTQFICALTGTSSLDLDVDFVKKLRIYLRNESASWTQDFLATGGYDAVLTRLNELLEVEWRDEQHDDQLLYELLRILKALSTSAAGCAALRAAAPTPFTQLVSLLYSDKKPGDVATRLLIVELLLLLFELYPASALPSRGSPAFHRESWSASSATLASGARAAAPTNLVHLPHPHPHTLSLVRALLLTPAPTPVEAPETPVAPHAFIESLHRPRIFKAYLQELSDVCRDYFWVFCHPANPVWSLKDTDEERVERPRAPGGMTGGVEYEAMGYLTTHLKLLNAVAKAAQDLNLPPDNTLSAHQLHADLFLSGLERILLIARKASTTYYPTLHLEIARYVALAGAAKYELPWSISRLVGPPPANSNARVKSATSASASARGSPQTSPSKTQHKPMLPSPRRTEPLKFD
ncbi:hypothetical protein FA95DRAFT_1586737 [Auriscalpium vulgare]|uniref:Uncharacterized protein n=1 Tax=Auriscalpium vulgare TaxID=40419 RepID=A0ACB8S8Q7_9AGAM|nr:hypothetical protein FA95DRAFT_1586737 [Auriscalpium vulgare]